MAGYLACWVSAAWRAAAAWPLASSTSAPSPASCRRNLHPTTSSSAPLAQNRPAQMKCRGLDTGRLLRRGRGCAGGPWRGPATAPRAPAAETPRTPVAARAARTRHASALCCPGFVAQRKKRRVGWRTSSLAAASCECSREYRRSACLAAAAAAFSAAFAASLSSAPSALTLASASADRASAASRLLTSSRSAVASLATSAPVSRPSVGMWTAV